MVFFFHGSSHQSFSPTTLSAIAIYHATVRLILFQIFVDGHVMVRVIYMSMIGSRIMAQWLVEFVGCLAFSVKVVKH